MLRPVLVLLGLCLLSNSAWAQSCIDVRAVDFKNAAIRTGPAQANESRALIGGSTPLPDGFELRHGVVLLRDDPGAAQSSPPDWRVQLVADRKVQADAATWVRVIVLREDHLTGTSTWQVVLAYACEQGKLVRLLQYGGEGLSLKHLDAKTLELGLPLWKPKDAACCPSLHAELTYAWDEQQRRYRRARAEVKDGSAAE